MADFSNIVQEINTNLPDNNTQAITAEKLRTTLIDLTNQIDTVQDDFETNIQDELSNLVIDNLTSTDSDKALSANQGRILNAGYKSIEPDSSVANSFVRWATGEDYPNQNGWTINYYNVVENDVYLITIATTTTEAVGVICFFTNSVMNRTISIQGGSGIEKEYMIVIPSGIDTMKISFYGSNSPLVRKSSFKYYPEGIADGAVTTQKIADDAVSTSKIANSAVSTSKIANSAVSTSKIADGSISTQKIVDGAVTVDKLANSKPYENLLTTQRTYNLYDDNTMFIKGYYLDNAGIIHQASSWGMSDYIPVSPNTDYYCSATSWGRDFGYCWYDSDKNLILGSGGTIEGLHTSPSNAAYFCCNLRSNNNKTVDFMIAESSVQLPYKPYNVLPVSSVDGVDTMVESTVDESIAELFDYDLRLIKKNVSDTVYYDIYCGNNYIRSTTDSNNKIFNFNSLTKNGYLHSITDDIAPTHTLNTTIGANHAQPIVKATIEAHGLTYSDIGTEWIHGTNNKKYYIVRIYDADTIGLLSENAGTYSAPNFTLAPVGTITRNGVSKTISNVSNSQLWPMAKNRTIKFVIDGIETEIDTFDKNYYGDVIDVVESYDITNPVSVLNNLIANAGTYTENPVYDGNSAIRVENIYRFLKGLNRLIISNYIFLEETAINNIMFSQKQAIPSAKYYIPNSLPLSTTLTGFDFRTPQPFPLQTSQTINVDSNNVQDTNNPCNRVLMYRDESNFGIAIGILTDYGVGKKLNNYTSEYFEIRNDTGKIYPHPVDDSVVGNIMSVGNIYTAVMYQCLFDANTTSIDSNRLSMYHFNYNGAEYVYVDYKGSMLDKVVVDDSLNGKTVEVLESRNAELKVMNGGVSTDNQQSNIYNNGIYVDATYVSGETCFIVLKIK